jgi:hypothetical protein
MRDSVFCFGPFEIDVIVIKNGSYDDMTSSRLFFSPSQQILASEFVFVDARLVE